MAPSAALIGASRESRLSVRADSVAALLLASSSSSLLPLPRCYEAEVKTPWQSSRTSGKQGRLRRRIGTRREREREREKAYTKAAIFREGNQRRAFRAAYHQATSPLCRPPFHHNTATTRTTTTTTTTLSSRSRSPASISTPGGSFRSPSLGWI